MQRDLWPYEKRPTSMLRDLLILRCIKKDLRIWKETCVYMTRGLCLYEKKPTPIYRGLLTLLYIANVCIKETYVNWKKAYVYMKRDLRLCKETYWLYTVSQIPQLHCASVDRQERSCETEAGVKNTYEYMKRDLCLCEKRPTFMERDLLTLYCKSRSYIVNQLTDKKEAAKLSKRRIYTQEFCVYEKRPMSVWKELYVYMKRDLRLYEETYWLYTVSQIPQLHCESVNRQERGCETEAGVSLGCCRAFPWQLQAGVAVCCSVL